MPDGLGWFRWFGNNSLYMEVISWTKLLRDARNFRRTLRLRSAGEMSGIPGFNEDSGKNVLRLAVGRIRMAA